MDRVYQVKIMRYKGRVKLDNDTIFLLICFVSLSSLVTVDLVKRVSK